MKCRPTVVIAFCPNPILGPYSLASHPCVSCAACSPRLLSYSHLSRAQGLCQSICNVAGWEAGWHLPNFLFHFNHPTLSPTATTVTGPPHHYSHYPDARSYVFRPLLHNLFI